MTIENVKELIYDHITLENGMGIPPQESWEGIVEGVEWVDECIQNGYTIKQLRDELFDGVYEKWSDENEVDDDGDDDDDDE
jgi:hypothetical protein